MQCTAEQQSCVCRDKVMKKPPLVQNQQSSCHFLSHLWADPDSSAFGLQHQFCHG